MLQLFIGLCVLNFVYKLLQLLDFLGDCLVFSLSWACFNWDSGRFVHVRRWFGCKLLWLLLFGMLLRKDLFGALLLIDFLDAFMSGLIVRLVVHFVFKKTVVINCIE